jgi:hypothetical protein
MTMSINVTFDDGQPALEFDSLQLAKSCLQKKWPHLLYSWQWRSTGGPGSEIWLNAELDFLGASHSRLGVIANRSAEAVPHATILDRRSRM